MIWRDAEAEPSHPERDRQQRREPLPDRSRDRDRGKHAKPVHVWKWPQYAQHRQTERVPRADCRAKSARPRVARPQGEGMSSLVEHGRSTRNGKALRRIDFNDLAGNRRSLYLGTVTKTAGQQFQVFFDRLLERRILNQSLDSETTSWVRGLSSPCVEKLVRYGLVDKRLQKPPMPTIEEYLEACLADAQRRVLQNRLRASSVVQLSKTKGKLLDFFDKSIRIDRLAEFNAAEWREALFESRKKGKEKLELATVNLHCRNARGLFAHAVRNGVIESNPFGQLESDSPVPTEEEKRERYIERDDIFKVLEVLRGSKLRMVVALARFAGLRTPSETHCVEWRGVDFERQLFRVYSPKKHRAGTSAEKATRRVPILGYLRPFLNEAFTERQPDSKCVVSMSRNNLHRELREAMALAGVEAEWVRPFQSMRMSCEMDLLGAGTLPFVAALWMGHSPKVQEDHYAAILDEHFAAAAKIGTLPQQNTQQQAGAGGRREPQDAPADDSEKTDCQSESRCLASTCASSRSDTEWPRPDSNWRPRDYESLALTAELRGRFPNRVRFYGRGGYAWRRRRPSWPHPRVHEPHRRHLR